MINKYEINEGFCIAQFLRQSLLKAQGFTSKYAESVPAEE
jgi:hypothetical protein